MIIPCMRSPSACTVLTTGSPERVAEALSKSSRGSNAFVSPEFDSKVVSILAVYERFAVMTGVVGLCLALEDLGDVAVDVPTVARDSWLDVKMEPPRGGRASRVSRSSASLEDRVDLGVG